MSVQISNLTKTFGKQTAVNELSFTANTGEILGFLGPNGAGKSTTMKIITCYTPPTSGVVKVCDVDVVEQSLEARKLIGYLPEHNPLYLDMYIHEYLQFVGHTQGLKGKALRKRTEEMVALVGLTLEQNKKIGSLSKGYRQRVGLAQALIHDPKVLILDEPTTGLDPNQIVEVRNVIKQIAQDKTVILSTHIMQEVQALCDRVVIINRGNKLVDDRVENLINGDQSALIVEFTAPINHDVLAQLEAVIRVEALDGNRYRVVHNGDDDLRFKLFDIFKAENWQMIGMQQEEASLEAIFQSITQNND